jgi:hypothetical protein
MQRGLLEGLPRLSVRVTNAKGKEEPASESICPRNIGNNRLRSPEVVPLCMSVNTARFNFQQTHTQQKKKKKKQSLPCSSISDDARRAPARRGVVEAVQSSPPADAWWRSHHVGLANTALKRLLPANFFSFFTWQDFLN